MKKALLLSSAFLGVLLTLPSLQAEDETKILRATELVRSGETAEVFSLLSDASEAGPLSLSWQEIRALALYKSKNYEEAIDAFLELGKRSPATLEIHTPELAECYLLSGQPSLAEPLFQKMQEAADLNRFRGFINQLLLGKAAELESTLAKMDEGLVKNLSQASLLYLQDKKDEAKAAVLAAIKDQPEASTKPYLHTMQELGWAKDLDVPPPIAATTSTP